MGSKRRGRNLEREEKVFKDSKALLQFSRASMGKYVLPRGRRMNGDYTQNNFMVCGRGGG